MGKRKIVTVLLASSFILFGFSSERHNNVNVCFGAYSKGYYSLKASRQHNSIRSLIDNRKYDQAEKIALDLLKRNPGDNSARALLGKVYSDQYKLDAAYREYTKVLANDVNRFNI